MWEASILPFHRIKPVIELSKYLTLSQNMHEFYNFFSETSCHQILTLFVRLTMNPIFLHRFSCTFLRHRVECVCDKKRWLASISNICCSILRILMQVSGTSSIRGRKNY